MGILVEYMYRPESKLDKTNNVCACACVRACVYACV